MIRPILAVFAIVAIAAMMGAASVAPAYAAVTLEVNDIDIGEQKENTGFPSAAFRCGENNLTHIFQTTKITKEWSNNKLSSQTITKTEFFNSGGDSVMKGMETRSEVGEFFEKPFKTITQDNNKFWCTNGETDTTFEINDHAGSTTIYNKDGTVLIHDSDHGPT